jgi:two-component system OmpR family response regulator
MHRAAQQRIIVVDDEPEIRDMICEFLARDPYDLCSCDGAEDLDAALREQAADLVLLDVSMPGEDGISIARRIRANSSTPIIMLTALDDVIDRVVGLEVGADDYLTKPFDLRELRARVRAVLRRANEITSSDNTGGGTKLICLGDVYLDPDARKLMDSDRTDIPLTATEFDLLLTFARNPNRALSRDRLLDSAPGRDAESFDRAIDIRILRLRKKIERDPKRPQVIKTVRNIGYMFVPPATII